MCKVKYLVFPILFGTGHIIVLVVVVFVVVVVVVVVVFMWFAAAFIRSIHTIVFTIAEPCEMQTLAFSPAFASGMILRTGRLICPFGVRANFIGKSAAVDFPVANPSLPNAGGILKNYAQCKTFAMDFKSPFHKIFMQ